MSSFTSVFLSILVHAALIFAAFYFTQSFWFDEPEKKPEIAEYTMDLVPEEENKVVPLKKEQPKAQPKKVIKKKPVVARKPNPKLKAPIIIKKIRPAAEEKNLYTQKQKSPVSIEPSKQQVAGAPAAGSTVEAQDAATTLGVEDTASNPTVLSNNSNAEPTQQQVTGTPLEGPEEEAPEAATTLGVENSPTILANPNGVRDGRLLVQAPGNLPPKYPIVDRIRNSTGTVVVMGYVDEYGRVSKARVTESTGTPRMNANALKAFSEYKFQKGEKTWVKMPYEFTLGGEAKIISVRDRRTMDLIESSSL